MAIPAESHVPAPDTAHWATVAAAEAGFDAAKLKAAVEVAIAAESPWPRSFYYPDGRYVGIVEWNETGPWSEVTGPVKPRGGPAGLILKGGRIAAEWGDTRLTEMTFSVAKSYLAILAGLAAGDGLIKNIDDPVGATVQAPGSTARTTRRSHGGICCSSRASGRAKSGASPSRSTTTDRFPAATTAARGSCARCKHREPTTNTMMCA